MGLLSFLQICVNLLFELINVYAIPECDSLGTIETIGVYPLLVAKTTLIVSPIRRFFIRLPY